METSPDPSESDGEGAHDGLEFEEEINGAAARLEGSASDNVSTEREKGSMRGDSGSGTRIAASGGGGKENGDGKEGGDGNEEEGEWIDEEDDTDDDLLHLEYHPTYVVNPEKRRRRWDAKWDALMKAFHALDKQTDATLLLVAAPQHGKGKTMHIVRSRALRRSPNLSKAPELSHIKSSFRTLAAKRHALRTHGRSLSLTERLEQYYSSPQSSESGDGREDELRHALGAALGSLKALSMVYESREERWKVELGNMREENERVNVLLKQAFGNGRDMEWHEPMNHV